MVGTYLGTGTYLPTGRYWLIKVLGGPEKDRLGVWLGGGSSSEAKIMKLVASVSEGSQSPPSGPQFLHLVELQLSVVCKLLHQPSSCSPPHPPAHCQPPLNLLDVKLEVQDLVLHISDHFVCLGQRHSEEIHEELVSENNMWNAINLMIEWVVLHGR